MPEKYIFESMLCPNCRGSKWQYTPGGLAVQARLSLLTDALERPGRPQKKDLLWHADKLQLDINEAEDVLKIDCQHCNGTGETSKRVPLTRELLIQYMPELNPDL